MKIWGVYASKHWSAVMTYVREGQVESEPIEGRLHDVILYCFLLLGLIEEQKQQAQAEARSRNTARMDAIRQRNAEPKGREVGSRLLDRAYAGTD